VRHCLCLAGRRDVLFPVSEAQACIASGELTGALGLMTTLGFMELPPYRPGLLESEGPEAPG